MGIPFEQGVGSSTSS
jgi:hypothetical protein